MMTRKWILLLVLVGAACVGRATDVRATIRSDAHNGWILETGGLEFRLAQVDGKIYLAYFGPSGRPDWNASVGKGDSTAPPGQQYDIAGMAEGESLAPEDLEVVSHQELHLSGDVDGLQLTYRHQRLPLEIAVQYFTWGDTGVFTRQITILNKGAKPLAVESLPSLAFELPAGQYDLTYLWGGWGRERQLATEDLSAGERSFVATRGRSTYGYSPWFCLHSKNLETRFMAQLAYSGNWDMNFARRPQGRPLQEENLQVSLGMRPDFGGPLGLSPGESFALPSVAFTATVGDLDDGANQMHRYQRRYVVPRTKTNDPLLVQFNSWYPFGDKLQVEDLKRCADVAARLGAEVFVMDAGWFSGKNWEHELGDWTENPQEFPHGIQELAQYVRSKGLKFGIWVEIENLGVDSAMFRAHPDWCLAYNGSPVLEGNRYHLNFAIPAARQWARSVVDRLVKDYGIEWLKIDYNIDIGERFDPPQLAERRGHVLHDHLMSYYHWLDEVRAAYPQLVIENCSSGGTRFDLGIIAHTHTTWLSDVVNPLPSVQLGYGCTVEFIPEICNHWMVGDQDNGEVALTNPPGWWDFMFRVPMNGQFGISSRVSTWNDDLIRTATANVALYKRLRQVIMGADVYHLTVQPSHDDARDWSAVQYVAPDRKNSILFAYRLENGAATRVFKLRGLDPLRTYAVSVDGEAASDVSGANLSLAGLPVRLDSEWRAAVIELHERE
ncbi:MAG: alpha-galactosidase [Terriglobia bacterium]|jgi:alpha-galactosidase